MGGNDRQRIEAYLGRLFGYALSLGNDRDLARELVQECAVKALAARRTPVDEPAYRAWLFTILRHSFIDHTRRSGRAAGELDETMPLDGAQAWTATDGMISALTVKIGMAKLSSSHREIISLVDIVGLSYAEVASFLGLPVGTVMSRLSRARLCLLATLTTSNVRVLPEQRRRGGK